MSPDACLEIFDADGNRSAQALDTQQKATNGDQEWDEMFRPCMISNIYKINIKQSNSMFTKQRHHNANKDGNVTRLHQ